MQRPLLGAALALAVLAAGCHAGAAGSSGIPSVPSYLRPANLHPGTSNTSVVLTVPPGAANPKGLGGVAYANWLSHGTPVAQFAVDVSGSSPLCTSSGSTRLCTVPLSIAAGGPYEFVISTYAAKPVGGTFPVGTQIGGGLAARAIRAGASNRVALTTASALAGAAIALQPASIHAIDPATVAAIVTGLDAGGNAIVAKTFTNTAGTAASIRVAPDKASLPTLTIAPATVSAPQNGALTVTYASSRATTVQIAHGFIATLTATPKVSGGAAGSASLHALAPAVKEVALPEPTSYPHEIIAGPDGTMWFGEFNAGAVAHVTTSLKLVKTFRAFVHPQTLAVGSDGAIWVANNDGASRITRVTTAGAIKTYKLPDNTYPAGISAGPNNALWFGSVQDNYISWISTSGALGPQKALPAGNNYPFFSAMGKDGYEYFTLNGTAKVARVTPAGAVARLYTIPGTSPSPEDIVAGSDGKLWFTDDKQSAIFSMTPAGTFKKYAIARAYLPNGPLAFGPDGALWFVGGYSYVGRLNPSTGAVIAFTLPSTSVVPYGIALGPDGALYVTLTGPAAIARFQ